MQWGLLTSWRTFYRNVIICIQSSSRAFSISSSLPNVWYDLWSKNFQHPGSAWNLSYPDQGIGCSTFQRHTSHFHYIFGKLSLSAIFQNYHQWDWCIFAYVGPSFVCLSSRSLPPTPTTLQHCPKTLSTVSNTPPTLPHNSPTLPQHSSNTALTFYQGEEEKEKRGREKKEKTEIDVR